jgi:hypothetical protein
MKRLRLEPGTKVGMWTIIQQEEPQKGHSMFLCVCVCGEAAVIRGSSLIAGTSFSCGCTREGLKLSCTHNDKADQVEKFPWGENKNSFTKGVYMLLNVVNLYAYIDSSSNLKKKVKNHFSLLKANKHYSKHLQEDFNKYGQDKFVFIVLDSETEDLLETEKAYLQLYPFKYNIQYMEIARTAKVKIPKTSKIQPGVKYNKWTVLEETRRDKRGLVEYHCICECGNDRYVRGTYLKDGKSTSCGCIRVKNLKYKGIKIINDECKSSLPKDLPEEAVKTIKKIYSGVTL